MGVKSIERRDICMDTDISQIYDKNGIISNRELEVKILTK